SQFVLGVSLWDAWARGEARSPGPGCECAVSDSTGEPRRDLLDEPRIAIGILKGEERPVARALGIRAAEPCLHGERRTMPHLTRVDATADEFGMGSRDVGDDQRADSRTRRGGSYSLAECDRAR